MSDWQYGPVVEPVLVPATQDAPQTCDRWKPTYPDRIHRATSACLLVASMVVPVFVPAPENAPQTSDRWKPTYPDRIDRITLPASSRPFFTQNVSPIGPPSTEGNSYIIPAGAYDLWQYLPHVGPLEVPTEPAISVLQWHATYPDQLARRPSLLAAQHPSWSMDRFQVPDIGTVPALPGWLAVYPDRPPRADASAYRVQHFTIDAQTLRPADPIDQLAYRPLTPDFIYATPRLGTYVWGQSHFGYEVDVPVESWTGWYLDPPVLPLSPRAPLGQQVLAPVFVPDVTVPVTANSWAGSYPDIARALPQPSRAPAIVSAIFVPDVTVAAPTFGAQAIYPDRIALLRSVSVSAQTASVTDAKWTAPTPPVVPALAVAVYPFRVPGLAVPTPHPDYAMPAFVLDVTLPAPLLSWLPQYPDHVIVARFAHLAWYTEREWCYQFPLALFRSEWAINSNQYLGEISITPVMT